MPYNIQVMKHLDWSVLAKLSTVSFGLVRFVQLLYCRIGQSGNVGDNILFGGVLFGTM